MKTWLIPLLLFGSVPLFIAVLGIWLGMWLIPLLLFGSIPLFTAVLGIWLGVD